LLNFANNSILTTTVMIMFFIAVTVPHVHH
jgi:hypothetical protein